MSTIRIMNEAELEALERRARLVADWADEIRQESEEVADAAVELGKDVPWLVAEVRRLRQGPGPLGALLRYKRLQRGLRIEELGREAGVDPKLVRAFEEGQLPTVPETADALQAIKQTLGIGPEALPLH